MSSSKDLIPLQRGNIPIAQMRTVYRPGDVEKRLDKLDDDMQNLHVRVSLLEQRHPAHRGQIKEID